MSDEHSFGQWLRQQRKVHDLTQESLADRVGLSMEAIRKYESGTRRPSKETAEVLAKFFHVPPEEWPALVHLARTGDGTDESTLWLHVLARPSASIPARVPSSNLPAQRTPFIGRESLVRQVRALLEGEVRLVSLTGPPGIGKTRLSIEVANRMLAEFPDGVYWVPLSPVTDPELVVPAIAQALHVKEASNQPRLEALKSFLNEKRLLLVLDNFEHVVSASPLVVELLVACPSLKVLTSSREALRLYGEQQFEVPPMLLPEGEEEQDPATVSQYEAVQLFVQRAKAVRPDFELTAQNAPAVVEICRRLDALPLAIELAAARTKLLSPEPLLARLTNRLALLTTGPVDLPVRQQTLRGAIDWSYSLLEDNEKAVLGWLSVFVQGCDLDAVESLVGGVRESVVAGNELALSPHPAGHEVVPAYVEPSSNESRGNGHLMPPSPVPGGAFDVLDTLTSLVDKSLVRQTEVEGEPRFSMLLTIREYAQQRLAESGKEPLLRRLHAGYFLGLAETAEPRLTSSGRGIWLQRLDTAHYNLLAALEWSSSPAGNSKMGLRLAGALGWYWYFAGYLTEGYYWQERALSAAGTEGGPGLRAKVLNTLARLSARMINFGGMRPWLEESVALSRQSGDKRELAYALCLLGLVLIRQGDPSAIALCEESLSLFEGVGDRWGLAYASDYTADAYSWLANDARRVELYQKSLDLYRELNDDWGIAAELRELAGMYLESGDYQRAIGEYEESLEIDSRNGNRWNMAYSYYGLAISLHATGDLESASDSYENARKLFKVLGVKPGVAGATRLLGRLAQEKGDYSRAVSLLSEALGMAGELNNAQITVFCLLYAGGLVDQLGSAWKAAMLLGAVDTLARASNMTLTSFDGANYKNHLEKVQRELGPEDFTAAWKHGAAMTLEDAAQYAASCLNELKITIE